MLILNGALPSRYHPLNVEKINGRITNNLEYGMKSVVATNAPASLSNPARAKSKRQDFWKNLLSVGARVLDFSSRVFCNPADLSRVLRKRKKKKLEPNRYSSPAPWRGIDFSRASYEVLLLTLVYHVRDLQFRCQVRGWWLGVLKIIFRYRGGPWLSSILREAVVKIKCCWTHRNFIGGDASLRKMRLRGSE